MSGPEETSESAVDSASPATDGAPTTPAPPSFGQAGAPAAETERAAPSFAVPLFGPDKPWWAATPDDDVEDDPEPETQADEPVPEPQAEDEPDAEPEVQAAAEEAPPAPEPPREDTRDEPPPEAAPGHLVAGAGAPEVDTRGAVPPPPVPDTPSPAYADTDPDGIPVYPGPQDDAEAPEETEPFRIEADDSEGALTPDAVLPPGVSPVEYVTPRHEGVPHTASATAYTEQAPDGGVILVVSQTQPDGVPP
ncbi:MAG TPA: hypothetical protein VHJ17_20905, partial [Thermomonospora sp.]|nr:hypothetical protein [Thermomonospora sp.]